MQKGILDLFNHVTVKESFALQLEKTEIDTCKIDIGSNSIDIALSCQKPLCRLDLLEYTDAVSSVYHLNDLNITLLMPGFMPDEDYLNGIVDAFLYNCKVCQPFLSNAKCSFADNTVTISGIIGGDSVLSRNNFAEFVHSTIQKELGKDLDIAMNFVKIDMDNFIAEHDKIEREISEKKAVSSVVPKESAPAVKSGLLYGKPIPTPAVPIISLSLSPDGSSPETYVISGEVLTFDLREIKGNERFGNGPRNSITFAIGDSSYACTCNIFADAERLTSVKRYVSKGSFVKVSGTYEYDNFARKPLLKTRSIELLESPAQPIDTSDEKRVELHMHTKMSAMDAVSSVGDLIKRAAKWGHKAIAVTDHGVAQAFPDAYKAASKIKKAGQNFKVIYGMEGYLINDCEHSSEFSALDLNGSFVVFDIETTGLSASECKITEIGAVKITNGKKTDSFSQLINPEVHIPEKITALTGISDSMVADKPTIAAVLPEFLAFCNGCTVIAHNALFDCGFIRFNAAALGLEFHNKIADTLLMSKELFPDEKRHSLDAVCSRLGVKLENHHRAVDDATATAEIFLKFIDIYNNSSTKHKGKKIESDPDMVKSLQRYHVILLAKNYVGLKNLYKLISISNLNYFYKKPLLPKSIIEKYRDGIIIGSACESGELYRSIISKKSDSELKKLASFYDYLEIQPICNNSFMLRNGTVSSEADLVNINKQIVSLGDSLGIPTVATCDVHFMDKSDAIYRQVLLGAQGFSDADDQPMLYLRTTNEMLEEFSYLGDEKAKEVVITNTNMIADMCEEIQPVKDGSYPPSIENCEQDLIDMCHKKAHRIYGDVLPPIVQARMDKELDCITKYGYSVMYMIAHKLVKKSNDAGYLVGSRGSVGSSFAAFLSDITEVNALCPHYVCPNCKHSEWFEHGEYPTGIDMPDKVCPDCGTKMKKDGLMIPFETFLGFKGDKVPDIDLNFSGEYQATAHKYVGELFGDEHVFKAGTISTIADKTAIGFAKKYYELKGISASEEELMRISRGIVDVKRTTGQHPGGIIVCPKTMDIHDFCPVQHPADKKDSDIITTHFDFHSIHDNLLKLDILGHDDPSTIRMLEDLTGVDALDLPLDDEKVMSLFSGTEALGITPEQIDSPVGTFGIPEFGTSFVRGMLVDTKPTKFVELLIISGLSHGTDVWLNNAQDLVKKKIASLSEVIGLRDDIMVYLIQHNLDPSMSFNIMELVRKGKAAENGMPEEFEKAMIENNVPDWYIQSCKKIKYMFPKAHAAAYVMMALRIAYFKVYYPVEFYIAYFTVRADLFDAALMTRGVDAVKREMQRISMSDSPATANEKSLYTILELCREMYARGIEFLPVDLYESHAVKFRKIGGKILPPLNAFAGVGESAAYSIMEAAKNGKFLSIEDLKTRAGITKAVIETLKENGVLNGIPETSQLDFLGNMFS